MKTKYIFILVFLAMVTLSFTFVSVKSESTQPTPESTTANHSEPIGGFALDDKF